MAERATLKQFLAGRIWLRHLLPFPADLVDEAISRGEIHVQQGVQKKKVWHGTRYTCQRCHNENPARFTVFDCAQCESACAYCRNCLNMGRVSCCSELVTWTGTEPVFPTEHRMNWQGNLTPSQQKAANELLESTKQGVSHLLYAVCGSGKTEMLFQPIHYLLNEGRRVCLAAPRVDVILELMPRLTAAFPDTCTEALYGGADVEHVDAQLILATTHQLYRFHEAFDAVFVDEADAFPYTADETLQQAVRKAAKPNAPIHFVTATPSSRLLAMNKKQGNISILARRYHGQPLPVPRNAALWNYERQLKKKRIPKKLLDWTKECLEQQLPFLIFFHQIELMELAEPLFQQLDERICAVHAEHADRKERVQLLRQKEIPGLLTTTILERGITIPNVQVAVVGAEQTIFNKGALIQIGGRVGRSVPHTSGDFVLFHQGITSAMDEAKREIRKLNRTEVPQ
ncbi:DNA/RNA helicase [Sporosarcina sp. P37]|uniref:DEAD/DEAH box helicase n=1 Tax=unclassified Sporosarcina TaxID=2647733 RepID=UPI000A17AE07|nr:MULTISPECIES: DEAD/DEAH box helicase family protein [unclassified Sporosarcina]ARK25506.1 DNA/RNA helicase [Sporosarcina sp. P37]